MHVKIIAEIGVNHNGNLELAKEMIKTAAKAGVDVVKFQTAIPELMISKFAPKANYQEKTTGTKDSQLEMVKKINLPFEDFKILKEECEINNVEFLSTPFDIESIRFLDALGVNIWKVPSGEITNLPYLVEIAKTHKDIILSTGMCNMNEIKQAIHTLKSNGASSITILHCTTEYPAPFDEVNLNVIHTFKQEFGMNIGYSDHTKGIEVSIAAVAMGATIIEKHFTLDKNMEGPDHKASLEPHELGKLVKSIRNIEKAMGNGLKIATESEERNKIVARKSIVAKCEIKVGQTLSTENITTKRPGSGVSPMEWYNVIGTMAIRDFQEDELIEI